MGLDPYPWLYFVYGIPYKGYDLDVAYKNPCKAGAMQGLILPGNEAVG